MSEEKPSGFFIPAGQFQEMCTMDILSSIKMALRVLKDRSLNSSNIVDMVEIIKETATILLEGM